MSELPCSQLDTTETKAYCLRSRRPTIKQSSFRKVDIRRATSRSRYPDKLNKLSNRSVLRVHGSRFKQQNAADQVLADELLSTPKGCSPCKLSPIKTRRLQKSKQLDITRCTICKSCKGDLSACAKCHKYYHLSKCVLYSPGMVIRVQQVYWLCPKCIRCSTCKLMIDDPTNVECGNCLRAWHGSCKPTGSIVLDRQWFCNVCSKKVNLEELINDGNDNAREMLQSSSKCVESFVSLPMTPVSSAEDYEKHSRRKSRLSRSPKQFVIPCTSTTPYNSTSVLEDVDSFLKENEDTHRHSAASDENSKVCHHSPRKQRSSAEAVTVCFSELGSEMFDKALDTFTEVHTLNGSTPSKKIDEQWVNLGGDSDIKALYESPYPDHIKSVPLFFVCAYCLKPFSDRCSFFVHQDCCPRVTPPGTEIYRDSASTLSFFEVDGARELTYCRNLCLFAMLFISSKTLHIEVGTFLFYILTKNDDDGCRIVGYFSKEKNPSRNNNLSCLLTIPSEQRNGYGHLLIDMSYKLSDIERKVGSPEHPLSDLGLYTYRKYWKSSILCYLRSIKDSSSVSIKNMSLHTRIHPTDIVNELMRCNLLLMKDGNYLIKTWRLAYKLPLSALRRRVVDSSRIRWTPTFDLMEKVRKGNEGMLMWLPSELLLLIFSHIRGRHLVRDVRLVCKKFHSLLANQHWWLSRIHKMPHHIRLLECEMKEDHFDAARSFVVIEEEMHRWSSWVASSNLIVSGHIATVDAIRLFSHESYENMFCLSGGRDRAIKLWNINDLQKCHENSAPMKACVDLQNAHEGWIWCLDQSFCSPEQFLSCSWDCTVKLWQITPSQVVPIECTKLGSAGMCLSNSKNGLAACSTFGKKVFIMDTRNTLSHVLEYAHHKGAVLTLAMQDNIVYSCGEDRRIVMVDIRNSSKPVSGVWSMDYVRSVCLRNNQLICGTHLGLISALDPGTLNVCSQFQVSSGVRQVIHSGGAILEISRDRTFKAFTVGIRSSVVAELSFDCDPCRFDYRNGHLAISAGDGSILIWENNGRAELLQQG